MNNRKPICLSTRLRAGLFQLRSRPHRALFALAIVATLALGVDGTCRADLIVEAPSSLNVTPGSSGSFDVLITSTGGSYSVAIDDIELTLTGASGVSFTGISLNTVTHYIYGANSASLFGSTFIVNVSSNDVEAYDYFFPTGAQPINPGDMFGLLNVQYTVAADAVPGTSGALGIGPDTLVLDGSGASVNPTFQGGSISVITTSVPEPATACLLAIGCATVVVRSARKRCAR